MGTNFVMGPPPYPLEWILAKATAPGGAYHGTYATRLRHRRLPVRDRPVHAGLVPDRAEDGGGARDGLKHWGFHGAPSAGQLSAAFSVAQDGRFAMRRAVARRRITYMFGQPRTVERGF